MSAIDISSLDQEVQDKIAAYRARCAELSAGIFRDIDIKWKIGVNWSSGMEPSVIECQNQPDWAAIKLSEEEFLSGIKEEVRQIVLFCNELADQLGVTDKYLWDKFFAV